MLSHTVSEHHRAAALESVGVVTSALLDSVNSGVAEVFVNQEELEREVKQLQTQSVRLAKSANEWASMVGDVSRALKVQRLYLYS